MFKELFELCLIILIVISFIAVLGAYFGRVNHEQWKECYELTQDKAYCSERYTF